LASSGRASPSPHGESWRCFGSLFKHTSVRSRDVSFRDLRQVLRQTIPFSPGSECMYQMLKALFPSIANIPNRLGSEISSKQLLCYFLFWLFQLPFLFISPQSLRWLFLAKAIIVPPALFAMLGWAFATTGGGAIFQQKGSLSGYQLVWTWLGALNSTLGTITTLAVNIPDFTRYARSKQEYVTTYFIMPLY